MRLGVLLASAGAAGLLTAAGTAGPAANSAAFQDARGEEPEGPDITSVMVSNGDVGNITFRIEVPSHPAFTDDMRLRLWLDSDRNAATGLAEGPGSTVGWDHYILWDRDLAPDPRLFRCERSLCTAGPVDPPQRTLRFSYAGGPRFTILAAELADTKRFRFFVEAADYATGRWDFAPELGRSWDYDVRLAPERLLARHFSTAPPAPVAGETFTVRLTATESPSGAVVTQGRVGCAASVGGKAIRARAQGFVDRRATCVFAVPADATGKTIRGTIAVRFKGKTVTKAFARRIG
jgi:hypothetical protein